MITPIESTVPPARFHGRTEPCPACGRERHVDVRTGQQKPHRVARVNRHRGQVPWCSGVPGDSL